MLMSVRVSESSFRSGGGGSILMVLYGKARVARIVTLGTLLSFDRVVRQFSDVMVCRYH